MKNKWLVNWRFKVVLLELKDQVIAVELSKGTNMQALKVFVEMWKEGHLLVKLFFFSHFCLVLPGLHFCLFVENKIKHRSFL